MKLSLFSISYAGFWGQEKLSLLDFLGKAAQLGYEGVMIAGKRPHLSPLDADEGTLEQLRGELERHGLRCFVIGAYTDFSPSVSELPGTELQISYVEQLSRIARALGAKVVRVFTSYENSSESPLACWRRLTSVFQELADRAAPHDVTIAIQNHHDFGIATPALVEFLSDIDRPNCKLGFDAWSPALRGEDLYQAALAAAPFTAITTNADYARYPRFRYQPELVNYAREEVDMVRATPFGDGFIDFEAFFRGLREGGFDGVATYEMCSPLRGGGALANLDRCAARYVEWMKTRGLASS